jgi:hypothetical protein
MKENISFAQKAGFFRTSSIIDPFKMVMNGFVIFLTLLISSTGSATEFRDGKTSSSGGMLYYTTETAWMPSDLAPGYGPCGATIEPTTGTSCTATSETVKYGLKLRNTGNKATIFLISSANEKSSGIYNPDKTSTRTNVGLNSECRDNNNNLITQIEIQPNQEIIFYLLVFVPKGSPKGLWNSIMVKVNPILCPETEISISVFTYIPDPEKDVLGFMDKSSLNQKLFFTYHGKVFILDGQI